MLTSTYYAAFGLVSMKNITGRLAVYAHPVKVVRKFKMIGI